MSAKSNDVCGTCNKGAYYCPGHCGHIEMPVPVYNPFFYDQLRLIFACICSRCHRFQAKGIFYLFFRLILNNLLISWNL